MSQVALDKIDAALRAFLAVADAGGTPDVIATAFAQHLAGLDAGKLAPAAQQLWEIVRRLLKAPGCGAISARAVNALSSWPAARIRELIEAVRALAVEVSRAVNDRLADDTNERVSRAYL